MSEPITYSCQVPGCEWEHEVKYPHCISLHEALVLARLTRDTVDQHVSSHFLPENPQPHDDLPQLGGLTGPDGTPLVRFAPGWVGAVHLHQDGFAQVVGVPQFPTAELARQAIEVGAQILLGLASAPTTTMATPLSAEELTTLARFGTEPDAEGTEDHAKKGPLL